MYGVSSARGVLSLLRETDNSILLFALKRVCELMDTYWHEISIDLPLIVELNESESLTTETRQLAALVASYVYFHLGELDDSVQSALAAGPAFDGSKRSLFTDTILSRCIDMYVQYQESPEDSRLPIDPKLEALFVSLTQQWMLQDESMNEVKEMVGFTIRARRLDFLERVLKQCLVKSRSADILNYTFGVANVLLRDITFRREILRLLATLYTDALTTVDYFALAQCLLFLGDVSATANLIRGLLKAENNMVAYQLAFDLFEYGNQEFLSALMAALDSDEESKAVAAAAATTTTAGPAAAGGDAGAVAAPPQTPHAKLLSVLSGEVTTNLHLKFLYARCAADIHVLNLIKKQIDPKKSVVHNATVLANAFMYSGTTIDGFLRDNMTWMGKANYWAKFTATASVGAIHKGHTKEAMKVLDPYLPKTNSIPQLPYQEAGALYALGLIHAPVGVSRDQEVTTYIREKLYKFGANTQMVHGASLGIGLSAMGLQDESIYEALFTCVSGDAVGGEAAAVGIGLLMMGSGNQTAVDSLKNLANEDNQKEKIIRGTSMAMALINLGRENEALGLADELLESGDPWIRLGGCFVLGLAFAGTENTTAIERLLQVTVKDTSDDVRRNAATMIGFLTFKDPELCVDLTRPLVDSYNPHIRYGVAMALAVSAAGTGRDSVINVLWEMKDDLADYVRQGVYIGLAIVMAQLTEKENPKVREFRQLIEKKVADRKEDVCTKFGCILASGLIDAGGRNCTFSLHRDRHRLDKAVVGMFMFTQYWYWFPYALMVSLAMQPTCFIGLNDALEMPEYTFKSNAPPSQFAPPKSVLQEKKEVKSTGVQAVVLSTTRKEEQIRQRRHRTGAGGAGEDGGESKNADGNAAGKEGEEKKESEEPEPTFEVLHNPARVTAHQFAVITHNVDGRYVPLKPNAVGVCLLRDTKPEMGEQKLADAIVLADYEDAPTPEPFSYP